MKKNKNIKNNTPRIIPLKIQMVGFIMAIIIPLLLLLSSVNLYQSRKDFLNADKLMQVQTENAIENSIRLLASGYKMLEAPLDEKLEQAMKIFIGDYIENGSPDKMDLNALSQKLGGKMKLYIIDDQGVVKFTTYKKDINLDFKQWTDYYKIITAMREGTKFSPDALATESSTGIVTKYAYMPTPDHKYLFEIGISSEEFKSIMSEMDYTKIAKSLQNLNPALEKIRIMRPNSDAVLGEANYKPNPEVLENVKKVSATSKIYETPEKNNQYKKYMFVELKNEKYALDTSKVVELTYRTDLVKKALNEKMLYSVIIIAVGIFIGIFLIFLLAGKINKMLQRIIKGINTIASGDFTHKISIKSNSELKLFEDSINAMTDELMTLICDIGNSAEYTASAAEELQSSSDENAIAIEHIACSISEITHSVSEQEKMTELSSNVLLEFGGKMSQIKEKIHIVSESANSILTKSTNGLAYIENTIYQIKNIKEINQQVFTVINALDQSSTEIGSITNAIQSIASQTNLLALNAAIEAARAGESGKGFAVVADEVRKLAEQSTNFVKIIHNLIEKNQSDTKKAVVTIEKGMNGVFEGEKIAVEAGELFKVISTDIENTVKNIQGMSFASDELDKNKDSIERAIWGLQSNAKEISEQTTNVAAITEEQSASVAEIAKAANHLTDMSEGLIAAIYKFKVK